MKPPFARRQAVEHELHGHRWMDEFDWLRAQNWQACVDEPERLPAEIKSYLAEENSWCETSMADTNTLQTLIQSEMRGRMQADDESLPDEEGPWSYIERYRGDDEYPSYWRRPRGGVSIERKARVESEVTEDEQLLIDFNVESEGCQYYSLGDVEYSPDHAFLAWSVDTAGAERHTVRIRNLQTGQDEDTLTDVESITWGDARHVFYTRVGGDHRAAHVYRHELGTDTREDELLYEELDPRFYCSVWTSLSADYVFISADMSDQSEVWFIPCSDITAKPVLIEARSEDLEYNIEHQGNRFLILTNADGASDFKIMQTSTLTPSREHWVDFLPSRSQCMVLDIHAYQDWVMWMEREDALPRICYAYSPGNAADNHDESSLLSELMPESIQRIDFEEQAYALSLEPLLEFSENRFRFDYESPSTPSQCWLFDLKTRTRTLLKQEVIPSGHHPEDYIVQRLHARSTDGETVPVTILHHRETQLDALAPCYLTAYGAYGSSSPATFSSSILSLVDRGFVYALAHVRGGQEKGRAWYEAARFAGKTRSIDDVIAVGELLVAEHFTDRGRIVLSGASAGGLLVGATLNRDCDLWAAAVADVPFVDVMHTLMDDSLPLTPGEWGQWGDPRESEEMFEAIRSYCPYLNVQSREYPPILVTAGISDSRVTYWEPAKWVAKHRLLRADSNSLLLKTNLQGGHFGESGRYASLIDTALEYAFALKATGFPLPE